MTKEQSLSLVETVNELQPNILINSRIGNGAGNYSTYGDHQIPSSNITGLWEAIYGASPSPWKRPFSWGDCTVKSDKLFFFIFDWKPGMALNVFGLENKIKSASKNGHNIDFKVENPGWISFRLPQRKQQQLIEVLEVEIEGDPVVNPELSVDDAQATILGADFALAEGCNLNVSSWMEKFGTWKHVSNLSNWENTESKASWLIHVKAPGRYYVDLEYNAFVDSDENEWDIFTENSSTIRYLSLETTGAEKIKKWPPVRYRYRKSRVGVIDISKSGKQTLVIQPTTKVKGDGMQLKSIHLQPIEEY